MLFKIKETKRKPNKNEEKYGFKREHAMMDSTQNPMQKNFDSGKA